MAAAHVQEFINELWPHAVAIGDANGIDPITIVTQAAIETGWGKEVAGNNYFGIKSHGRSGGQVITTHEEIDGKRVKVQDSFRVYGSLAESVEDYARFLHENPRYAGALKETGFEKQLAGITSAGYATDSKYLDLVNGVSKMVARAAPLTPPGSIPNTVGSQLDVVPQTPSAAQTAARINRMFDRVDPAPRSDATLARTNAMLSSMEEVAATPLPRPRPERAAPGLGASAAPVQVQARLPELAPPRTMATPTPPGIALPRPRPDRAPTQQDPTVARAPAPPSSTTYEYAPNGRPRDPDNGFLMAPTDPRYAGAMAASPRPGQATPPAPVSAPTATQRPAPPSGGFAGQDRAVATQPQTQPAAARPNQAAAPGRLVGQDAVRPAAPSAPAAVATPDPPKYIVTYERKRVPLGDVVHVGSRDTVKQAQDGKAAAEKVTFVNRKVTTLNPDYIAAQNAAGATPPVRAPARAPQAGEDQSLGDQLLGGTRQAIGLPREGIGGAVRGAVQGALGIPEDGIGAGIGRGIQRLIGGIGLRPPSIQPRDNRYYTNPAAFGQAAVNQSGDTSTGNQAEAGALRASGNAWRESQEARRR